MERISCRTCPNTHCFLQQYCSAQWVKKIDAGKSQAFYKEDNYIIYEGTRVLGLYFIHRGKVKVFSTGLHRRKQIVRFAREGHILGHRGLGNEVYPISAVAMEDSVVCFLDNNMLNEIFIENPRLTVALMMFYSQELRKAEERLKALGQMNRRERTAEALLMMIEVFGLTGKKGINAPFARYDIADVAGTSTEEVTRQLGGLEKEGVLAKDGKKIMIPDMEKLRDVIREFNLHVIKEE